MQDKIIKNVSSVFSICVHLLSKGKALKPLCPTLTPDSQTFVRVESGVKLFMKIFLRHSWRFSQYILIISDYFSHSCSASLIYLIPTKRYTAEAQLPLTCLHVSTEVFLVGKACWDNSVSLRLQTASGLVYL